MQTRNVPATGPRYWTAISIASVCGANLGDFVSHNLHMGHWRGLLPLAVILAGILLAERRTRPSSELFYWLAIVTLRTAATNLADLGTHDLKLGYGAVIVVLALALVAVLVIRHGAPAEPRPNGVPPTTGRYWLAMLIAGTLGTAIGDAGSDGLDLGAGLASLLFGACLAGVFAVRMLPAFVTVGVYWATIVAIRTTGTTVGDFLADATGLATSTACSGLLLAGLLLLWKAKTASLRASAVGTG